MIHREEGMTKLDRKWISHTSEIKFPDSSEFPLPLWIRTSLRVYLMRMRSSCNPDSDIHKIPLSLSGTISYPTTRVAKEIYYWTWNCL